MLILVTGGAASGKSAYAEELVAELGERKRYYLATMEVLDEESKKRVAVHRKLRLHKGFETIELTRGIQKASSLISGGTGLLECLSNLLANEMYSPLGAGEAAVTEIIAGIEVLNTKLTHLIIVSNEIFADGLQEPSMDIYIKNLGRLNQAIAKKADRVIEVVCGIGIER